MSPPRRPRNKTGQRQDPRMTHDLDSWIGREQHRSGILHPELAEAFAATLDLPPQDGVPLGLHWCLGLDNVPTAQLGPDGHPPRGDFLPPVALPRRMWASGTLDIHAPLLLGQRIDRHSRIAAIQEKTGGSGTLCFVTVEHRVTADGRLAITERQDIVYRAAGTPGDPGALPEDAPTALPPRSRRLMPTPPLLFRYSALTFNAHRIHYDLPYAREVEGYPGLVVHGPLQATLLAAHAAAELGRPLTRFAFRGRVPAFAGLSLTLRAEEDGKGGLSLRSEQGGTACMTAEAR